MKNYSSPCFQSWTKSDLIVNLKKLIWVWIEASTGLEGEHLHGETLIGAMLSKFWGLDTSAVKILCGLFFELLKLGHMRNFEYSIEIQRSWMSNISSKLTQTTNGKEASSTP